MNASRASTAALAMAVVLTLTILCTKSAQGQTYRVIYNFIGGTDGFAPYAGVTMDAAGNLYGTTSDTPASSGGTVYKLTPKHTGWVYSRLHFFTGGTDGALPWAGVVFGPDGNLYGTTYAGGASGVGTVFSLSPPATVCRAVTCPWTETVLYSFTGRGNAYPSFGDLTFDGAGNMYGTTNPNGYEGVVYQLARSGNGWTESVLYTFSDPFGAGASGGVILDNAGNLYGTTFQGGGDGDVFKLTYSPESGWTESVLYYFQGENDGFYPYSGLIYDSAGNLYGSTTYGGEGGGGTVFELTPSGSGWNYALLYSFTGAPYSPCGPWGPLYMDAAGNLYGTTYCDGANGKGNIFKLTRSNGGWTYTSLHDFSLDTLEGANPVGGVIMDSQGNLYGTTSNGGTGCRYNNCGVVWEIRP